MGKKYYQQKIIKDKTIGRHMSKFLYYTINVVVHVSQMWFTVPNFLLYITCSKHIILYTQTVKKRAVVYTSTLPCGSHVQNTGSQSAMVIFCV